jgi:serine/threonine protein kinase
MSVATSTEFLEVLEKSGLVSTEELRRNLGSRIPRESVKLANHLVHTKVLTEFQAKQLLAGKHRGLLLGPYKILKPIGKGGMGAVYLAEHTTLSRKVALKILHQDEANNKISLERFQREAKAAAALDHPNIVRLHDFSHAAGVHFLVMEYVDGIDLQSLLEQTGKFHYAQAANYISQTAAGLQHAHEKGFIHRDIKPANLILTKDGTVKLLDMGLARNVSSPEDNLTANNLADGITGSLDYLPPETASNLQVDERSDVYSLGVTFYALLAGEPPFSGSLSQKLAQHQMKPATEVIKKIKTKVPDEISDIVAKMMAKKKAERYQKCVDVIEALAPWTQSSGSTTGNIPVKHTVGMPQSKSKKPLAIIGAIIALLAIIGVTFAVLQTGSGNVDDKRNTQTPKGTNPPPSATTAATTADIPNSDTPPTNSTTKLYYRWDLSTLLETRIDRSINEARGKSPLPAGWSFFQTGDSKCSHFCEITKIGGDKVVQFGKIEGTGAVQLSGTFTPPLIKDKTYKLRVEHNATGAIEGNVQIRRGFQEYGSKLYTKFSTDGGEWKWVEITFRTESGKPNELVVITNSTREAIPVAIRTLEVVEVEIP